MGKSAGITVKTSDFRKGERVQYVPKMETGTVNSVNDWFVFVRYDNSNSVQATRPEDLIKM